MNPAPRDEEALFQAAAVLSGPDRAVFLDRECADDLPLRARLEALLTAHEQADGALASHGDTRPTITLGLRDLPDPAVGQTIGRYKLLEKLGEGGCGVVYVAEQTEPVRRRVALKVIKLGMDTREVIARFEAERQALAMMDHPNIAKVLDAGTVGEKEEGRRQKDEVTKGGSAGTLHPSSFSLHTSHSGRPYFVMELVRGIRITEYCNRHKLSIKERLGLFIKVCQAIQHAHQKGIIHRDIKPSNILVTLHDGPAAAEVPKVIDFGIAKATEGRLTDATVYTQLHQFIGTPAYMSPEQAEMSGLDIDTRSDIYSLGVLLYELLTGTTPFDAKALIASGIDAMRLTIREKEPVRPSTRLRQSTLAAARADGSRFTTHDSPPPNRKSQIDPDLDWIVMKCLEKDRARRYETANGLAADLKRHLHHEPVVARPPSAGYRLQKSWRRNRLVYTAGAVVTATLVIGLGVSISALLKAQADRARAVEAQRDQSRALAQAEAAGQAATRERERAEAELWNSQLSEARALRIAGGPGARLTGETILGKLLLHPDQKEAQILSLRQEAIGQMALVDVNVQTGFVPTDGRWLRWDATLTRYVQGRATGDIEIRAHPAGNIVARLQGPSGAGWDDALFSADGRFLAVRFRLLSGAVQVWDIAAQELVLQTRDEQPANDSDPLFITPDSQTLALPTRDGLMLQALTKGSVPRLVQPGRIVHYLAFTSDSRRMAVFFADRKQAIEIWRTDTGETLHRFDPGVEPERLSWHPDDQRLAVAGGHQLAIWNFPTDDSPSPPTRSEAEFRGHTSLIVNVRFLPDRASLLTSSWDTTSVIWDLVSGRPLFRETRMELAQPSARGDQVVARWQPPHRESICGLFPRTALRTVARAPRRAVAAGVWLSPDSRLVAVTSNAAVPDPPECSLWNFERGVELGRFPGGWAQFSPDSRWLYVCGPQSPLRRYDVSVETLRQPSSDWQEGHEVYWPEEDHELNTCTLSADGRTAFLAAFGCVIVLDLEGRNPPRHLPAQAHAVTLSPDGALLATQFHNSPARLYDFTKGAQVTNSAAFAHFDFSPDNRWVSLSGGQQLRVLHRESFDPAAAIPVEPGADGGPRASAFSPDSRMIVLPYNQVDLRLYRVEDGAELATLSAPGAQRIGWGRALEFSRDGRWLIALREDGEVIAWDLRAIRDRLAKLGLDWQEIIPNSSPSLSGLLTGEGGSH